MKKGVHKSLSCILAALVIMMMLPISALATLDSTIEQDPGFTGGPDATAAVSGKTITFTGTIDYYTADAALGRTAGNRVGVKVTAPTGITPGASTTLTIPDGESTRTLTDWDTFKDGDDYFFYYPLVTSGTQTITFTVKWDGTDATADVFTVEIDGATLDPAPYTLTISPTETAGGAGYTRTVTIGGTEIANLAGKYLVVQFTSGTGANAKVSVVMIQLTADSTTVTVSYQTSGTAVDAWLASAMPNLTEPDMGVTIYADASTN